MLLLEIGRRLSEAAPQGATVARLGGDEFAVLLPDTRIDDAKETARSFLTALGAPYRLFEITLEVEASVGLAVWPAHGRDAGELLQRADVAMYDAKARHTGIEVYSPGIDRSSLRRLSLIGELRRAIDAGAVEIHYMPKVELRTGRAVAVEALARWRHPTLGAVPPDEFVSVAEQTGLIRPLTELVLVSALLQCARWRREGRHLRVAVNLSTRSLMDVELPDQVERLLERAEVPAADLILEITESSMLGEAGRVADILERLRGLGVELSIDDFGTGHSSLSYLKNLPVAEVKIDKSFVGTMVLDQSDAAIVASTIGLGHRLGLRVVAEGVEDGETMAALEALSCDEVQGYFLSKPLPAPELEAWLDRRTGADPVPAPLVAVAGR
jgi:predicted signal transduction protein with EAL and GGDEF domain